MIRIRPYKASDLPHLMDIGNRAWRPIRAEVRKVLGDRMYAVIQPDPEQSKGEQIKAHADQWPDWVWVAETEEGCVVGFVTFHVDTDKRVAEILNNAVDPDCGLKGVGQMMYRSVLDSFRTQGVWVVKVDTGLDDAHAPARRAYERLGFRHRLEHVTYYMDLGDEAETSDNRRPSR
jgi:ribosomal protein S18 acetylase RimI-like enzyme